MPTAECELEAANGPSLQECRERRIHSLQPQKEHIEYIWLDPSGKRLSGRSAFQMLVNHNSVGENLESIFEKTNLANLSTL